MGLASIRPHGLYRGCTIPALAPPPWVPACRGGWARPFANLGLCDPGGDDRAFAQGAVVSKKEENTSQYCGGLDVPSYAPAICNPWCPELSFQGLNHSGSFLPWLLLVPWAHSCILMTREALAKLQKRGVRGSSRASCWGFPLCLSCHLSTGQHCSGVTSWLPWAAWHWEHSSVRAESLFPLSVQSPGLTGGMVVTEAEEHSLPSCTCWMASLCHWVQHCSSNHLKTSQLVCPLLSQKQQGRTPAVQTFPSPCFPLLLQGEIKASEAPVPAWPGQDWLMVPTAFPGPQPDGSNESATSGLVKGIPPL